MSEELSNAIRVAINASGKRLPTIAKKTNVEVSALTEFMDGADFHLTTASKLASYLGLELKPIAVQPNPPGKGKHKSPAQRKGPRRT